RHTPVMLQKNKIIIRSQKPRFRSSPHLDVVRKLSAGQIFKHNVGSADVRITVSPGVLGDHIRVDRTCCKLYKRVNRTQTCSLRFVRTGVQSATTEALRRRGKAYILIYPRKKINRVGTI